MIPLLVKEKVKFYYYFDKWKENIKIMHDQYNKRVKIREDGYSGCLVITELKFRPDNGITSRICFLKFLLSGVDANKEFEDVIGPLRRIYNFTKDSRHLPPLTPLNYRYSSGRNNRKGFY
jgi:hypothetical protein